MNNKITGQTGEDLAAAYFVTIGYTILHRNWRFARYEIDIIATKDNTLHFIEVKSLGTTRIIEPEIHVTAKKMKSLKKAASHFLSKHPHVSIIQFNVLSVDLTKVNEPKFFLIEDVY